MDEDEEDQDDDALHRVKCSEKQSLQFLLSGRVDVPEAHGPVEREKQIHVVHEKGWKKRLTQTNLLKKYV